MAFLIFDEKKIEDFKKNNFIIDSKEKSVYVLVNPDVFDKDVVIAAAYSIQEFANVIIDSQKVKTKDDSGEESEKQYFLVKLISHSNKELEEIAYDFNNRLVNYSNYKYQAERYKEVKEKIMSEVYSQLKNQDYEDEYDDYDEENEEDYDECEEPEDSEDAEIEGVNDDALEDVDTSDDDILIPWEDKFSEEIKDKNDVYLNIEEKSEETKDSEEKTTEKNQDEKKGDSSDENAS